MRANRRKLRIGDRNRFREHVTVHRSNSLSEETVIGSDNFLMARTVTWATTRAWEIRSSGQRRALGAM